VRRKTTALVVLLLIMACTCYVTSAPLSVAPSASLSLYSFLNSFSGTAVTFAGDPVGGGPGGGGD
jgi:hypothetical protein